MHRTCWRFCVSVVIFGLWAPGEAMQGAGEGGTGGPIAQLQPPPAIDWLVPIPLAGPPQAALSPFVPTSMPSEAHIPHQDMDFSWSSVHDSEVMGGTPLPFGVPLDEALVNPLPTNCPSIEGQVTECALHLTNRAGQQLESAQGAALDRDDQDREKNVAQLNSNPQTPGSQQTAPPYPASGSTITGYIDMPPNNPWRQIIVEEFQRYTRSVRESFRDHRKAPKHQCKTLKLPTICIINKTRQWADELLKDSIELGYFAVVLYWMWETKQFVACRFSPNNPPTAEAYSALAKLAQTPLAFMRLIVVDVDGQYEEADLEVRIQWTNLNDRWAPRLIGWFRTAGIAQ